MLSTRQWETTFRRPDMAIGEFRCCFYARDYEKTLAFYRDGLEFPVLSSWDRSLDDRGTLFGAASGVIEVLALPRPQQQKPGEDYRAPQGVSLVIEADDVDASYQQ